jgi:hypothetical protein
MRSKTLLFLGLLGAILQSIATSSAQTGVVTEWFANSKESGTFYQKKIDSLIEPMSLRAAGDPPAILQIEQNAFHYVSPIFKKYREKFLGQLRSDAPLCEEWILAEWQELLPAGQMESFLYFLRNENEIDDLVLRVLLNVFEATNINGVFPPRKEVDFIVPFSLSEELQERVKTTEGRKTLREEERFLVELHFDPCLSKTYRKNSPKLDGFPKGLRRLRRAFHENTLKSLERLNVGEANLQKIADQLKAYEKSKGTEFGSEALTLDFIRRAATGVYFEYGKRLTMSKGPTRNRAMKTPVAERSTYLTAKSSQKGFSQRQWIYELAQRKGIDLLAVPVKRWKDIEEFIKPKYRLNRVLIDESTGVEVKAVSLPDPAKLKNELLDFIHDVRLDLVLLDTQMDFEQMVAVGVEGGNLRDEDTVSLYQLAVIWNENDLAADQKSKRKRFLMRIGSAATAVLPPPFNLFGIAAVTVIDLLGKKEGVYRSARERGVVLE